MCAALISDVQSHADLTGLATSPSHPHVEPDVPVVCPVASSTVSSHHVDSLSCPARPNAGHSIALTFLGGIAKLAKRANLLSE